MTYIILDKNMRFFSEIVKLAILPVCLIISLFTNTSSFGQDINKDLQKIHLAYASYPNISTEIQYNIYKSHESKKIIEQEFGYFLKNKNRVYTKLPEVITLYADTCTLVIVPLDKKIIITNPLQKTEPDLSLMGIDSIVKMIGTSSLLSETLEEKIYSVETTKGLNVEFDRFDLVIEKERFIYSKIVLYYKQPFNFSENEEQAEVYSKPRLEIFYSNTNTEADPEDPRLSMSTYVKSIRGKLVPSELYNSYSIVNVKSK